MLDGNTYKKEDNITQWEKGQDWWHRREHAEDSLEWSKVRMDGHFQENRHAKLGTSVKCIFMPLRYQLMITWRGACKFN